MLDQIVVDPGMIYQVSVSNLPKPEGGHAYVKSETVPGRLQTAIIVIIK